MPQKNISRSSLRSFLKIPLRTSLLLMALFASWLALRVSLSERAYKTIQLKELQQLLGESIFDDRSQFGLAKGQNHYNYDWQVYLPVGQKYELCWTLENQESNEIAVTSSKMDLEPGLHRVRLFPSWAESRTYLVTLTVDNKNTELGRCEKSGSRHDFLADIGTPKKYAGRKRGLGDWDRIAIYQQPTDQPLEIIHARGNTSSSFGMSSFGRKGRGEKLVTGIRLWITSSKRTQ